MTAECSKCNGNGRIAAFSHYAKGVCFACGGSKLVKANMSTAKSLADQESAYVGKLVVCRAYGAVYITKHGERFTATYDCGGLVAFIVKNGRVILEIASDCVRDAADRIRALQSLLKTA